MRILVYSINYAPELTGIGKYNGEMCVWLAARGHQVRVVAAPPYYPQWRVQTGWSAWAYRRETIDGVSVRRCPLWVPRRPSGLKRILHLLSFAVSSLPATLLQVFWRPQIVLVTEPPLFCLPAAWLLARMSRARLWLHVQDLEVDAARQLGLLKSGWLLRMVAGVETGLMRRCECVSTISAAMLANLHDKGIGPEKTWLFPNWIGAAQFANHDRDLAALRRSWGVSEADFVVLYAGNMGRKQGLGLLLQVAERLKDISGIHVWLCGDGAERADLQQRAETLGNVRFLPLQPEPRFRELMSLVHVHVLPQQAGAADLVMPSKLLGMFASGRPVVAAADPNTELQRVVEQRGLVVPPADADAMAAALRRLHADRALGAGLAQAAQQYARRHWLKDNVLDALERHMQALL